MATNSPLSPPNDPNAQTPGAAPEPLTAADLIRQKLERIYSEEPNAAQELAEAEAAPHRSKHQQFMYDLSASGKDLVTVQTEWHNYYQQLPDAEKHQVWQEFYSGQSLLVGRPAAGSEAQALAQHKQQAAQSSRAKPQSKAVSSRSPADIKAAIRDKVTAGGKLKAKHHLQSLLFGLSMGFIVLLILLFGFFNEVVIAPFIQPSRAEASTPLIVSSNSVAPSANPEVIIPKINVQIPVVYGQTSIDENVIQKSLENGVVHYPTTVLPGQNGNAAFFGHSSNNIFNKGRYKFAFVLLRTLVIGDTFYLTYQGKVYVYKVISRQVVDPSNVGVLNPVAGQTATATLITCDPPGTSSKRLVVVGQQISPDPASNAGAAPTAAPSDGDPAALSATPEILPGDGPKLLRRVLNSSTGKAVLGIVLIISGLIAVRLLNRRLSRNY